MKVRPKLRQARWRPAPIKQASQSPSPPIHIHTTVASDRDRSRTKNVLLSIDLVRFMALLLLFCGCEKTPTTTSLPAHKTEHSHAENEPPHSHEEEHGILPHKPRTFVDAVDQIDKRGHELLTHRHGHHITEWFDILGWLPEVAADTDLKKADWEAVVRIGRDLETWSAGWKVDDKSSPDPTRFDALVAELKTLVAKLPVRS
ncbi:MAG: hypothetical protein U0929_17655 [Planctomycetaceae bacterium]